MDPVGPGAAAGNPCPIPRPAHGHGAALPAPARGHVHAEQHGGRDGARRVLALGHPGGNDHARHRFGGDCHPAPPDGQLAGRGGAPGAARGAHHRPRQRGDHRRVGGGRLPADRADVRPAVRRARTSRCWRCCRASRSWACSACAAARCSGRPGPAASSGSTCWAWPATSRSICGGYQRWGPAGAGAASTCSYALGALLFLRWTARLGRRRSLLPCCPGQRTRGRPGGASRRWCDRASPPRRT